MKRTTCGYHSFRVLPLLFTLLGADFGFGTGYASGSNSVFANDFVLAPPDAGRILQETRPIFSAPPVHSPPILLPQPLDKSPPPLPPAASGDVRVQVSQFEFTGNHALSSEHLRAAVAPWAGRALNFGELIHVVETIETRYKDAGYFLAQGYLPPQKIKDGAIEIAISEGQLGEARLEGESRVAADVVFAYLDYLPKGVALRLPLLERQILLINELAGGQVSLDLQAGDREGSSDVVLVQQIENLVNGRVDLNNHGSPATGDNRIGVNLNINSVLNLGERITAGLLTTDTGNLTSYNIRGDFPVGGAGWRLSAAASRAEYSLGGAFSNLAAGGQADSMRVGATYSFIRSRASNLKFQFEVDQSKLVDRFGAAKLELDKESRAINLAINADWLDQFLTGGANRAELTLRAGRLKLGTDAGALDLPPAGADTAGNFSKGVLNLQRQQTLRRNLNLQLQFTDQRAGNNLDSSEKISFGGPAMLPGYATGTASGDSGSFTRMALRWQAQPELALTLFADKGRLRLAHQAPSTALINSVQLSDLGFAADWLSSKGFSVNAIMAWPRTPVVDGAGNGRAQGWISLGYNW